MLRGTHDNWEKLVGAVLDKEELRRIAYCESLSSSSSPDFSSRLSFQSVAPPASGISGKTLYSASTSTHHGTQPIKFTELKKATKSFHHDMRIGQGGIDPVFKGWIDEHTLRASKPGSGMPVTVKKCSLGSVQHKEYLTEVNYLSQLHHPNLVKLIGYCSEKDKLISVYEFMPRGSLDNHLFTREHKLLSWATRIKVALGAARALTFLHSLEIPVIHRDIKCGNILLDGDFNIKLTDFGRAIDGTTVDRSDVETGVIGTFGYIAPEYMEAGRLTTRCDVYGFGVVLLELISGLRAFDTKRPNGKHNLVDWAKPCIIHEEGVSQIIDSRLEGKYPPKEAYKVAKIALRCASSNPKLRPNMAKVVAELGEL